MPKYIYEYNQNYYNEPFKNQYTVVYENKTYFYCKVNGVDQLKEIRKSICNNANSIYFTSDVNPKSITIEQKLHEIEVLKLEKKINEYKVNVKKYEEWLTREKYELSKAEALLAKKK